MLRKLLPPIAVLLLVSGAYAALNNPVPGIGNEHNKQQKIPETHYPQENFLKNSLPFTGRLPYIPYSKKESSPAEESTDKKSPKDSLFGFSSGFLAAIFTGILVIIGGVQATFFYFQLKKMEIGIKDAKKSSDIAERAAIAAEMAAKATEISVEVARNSSEKQLRAYIGITHTFMNLNSIDIKISNAGSTPACKVIHKIDCKTVQFSRDQIINHEYKFSGNSESNYATVFPGVTYIYPINFANNMPKNAGATIFPFGIIIYEDIFGNVHKTIFSLKGTLGIFGWTFEPFGINEAT